MIFGGAALLRQQHRLEFGFKAAFKTNEVTAGAEARVHCDDLRHE
jgi:hypothetical protein